MKKLFVFCAIIVVVFAVCWAQTSGTDADADLLENMTHSNLVLVPLDPNDFTLTPLEKPVLNEAELSSEDEKSPPAERDEQEDVSQSVGNDPTTKAVEIATTSTEGSVANAPDVATDAPTDENDPETLATTANVPATGEKGLETVAPPMGSVNLRTTASNASTSTNSPPVVTNDPPLATNEATSAEPTDSPKDPQTTQATSTIAPTLATTAASTVLPPATTVVVTPSTATVAITTTTTTVATTVASTVLETTATTTTTTFKEHGKNVSHVLQCSIRLIILSILPLTFC